MESDHQFSEATFLTRATHHRLRSKAKRAAVIGALLARIVALTRAGGCGAIEGARLRCLTFPQKP
ncbi:hypothetical protein EPI10_025343 [Gossypium australe]|uniref:Uncharacterized protein n=1 Tax=Gossypium australe TaxID=47621 RepID=A0A5B6W0L4_9ROSI|nr:hypothetical protein EPI10_025343 [Gossypium australe]